MSREQMKKLLSEPTNEERLQAENEELHRVAEQATERGMKAEAELARLREELGRVRDGWKREHDDLVPENRRLRAENEQLRRAYESDAEAIEQATELARLREALAEADR